MSNWDFAGTAKDIDYLLAPQTIRERCQQVFESAMAGKTNFEIKLEKLDSVVELVYKVTQNNYPNWNIPFHARWRHFQAGGVDRIAFLRKALEKLSPEEKVRAKLDLAIVSVLLDAGAGEVWRYNENNGGFIVGRSEGLAIASLYMFLMGRFSSDPKYPYRVDAEALIDFPRESLEAGFQVSAENPLAGLEGRHKLLRALGGALKENEDFFPGAVLRPGNLYDFFKAEAIGNELQAELILAAVQRGLGVIWPNRVRISGFNMGDVWPYPPLGKSLGGLVPFHKLSQWLSYSLVEPLEEAGLKVTNLDDLTGLAEYRNGGLMLDSGLLQLRKKDLVNLEHKPESAIIVEWRALTIILLDKIGAALRERLGKSQADFPLAKALEGGTWWAGRKLAAERSESGAPPLKILSDGTVF